MRIEAYLRVLGTEAIIQELHRETNVPEAIIEELKSRRDGGLDEMWWSWRTQRVSINTVNPDDGLKTLLLAHRPIFPMIKRHQGPEADIYLEVVTRYEGGEQPQGLYLSAETVLLLSQMGGALDNDVYSG